MKKISRNTIILLLTAALAAFARIGTFAVFLHSPFRFFHQLPGLDLATHLSLAEWGSHARPFLSLHRVICAAIFFANGKSHCPELLYVIQECSGVLCAVLTAWCVLHLFRNRIYAFLAGMTAAWYVPALLYECTSLQESGVTFAFFLSFAAVLYARKRHFAWHPAVGAGILLALCTLGRPTCLLWAVAAGVWCWRKSRPHKRGLRVGAGILGVWIFCCAFNFLCCDWCAPFFLPEYVFHRAQTQNAAAGKMAPAGMSGKSVPSAPGKLGQVIRKAAGNIPKILSSHEIPDNLNYYFLRKKLHFPFFYPGPYPLIPMALAGAVLILFSGRLLRKEGLLLLPLACTILPLCALEAQGRYRLLWYPLLAILAFYGVAWSTRKSRKWLIFGAVLLIFLIGNRPPERFERSGDYVAWGMACEKMTDPPDDPLNCFAEAYFRSGGNEAAAVNLLTRLIPARKYDLAEKILQDALTHPQINSSLMNYYYGLLHLMRGEFDLCEKKLLFCDTAKIEKLSGKYCFFLAESQYFQQKKAASLVNYEKSLQDNLPESLKKTAKKRIMSLRKQ